MMNNSGPRYKRSQLEKRLNTDVLWCVFLLIVMCLTAAVGEDTCVCSSSKKGLRSEESNCDLLFYVFQVMASGLRTSETPSSRWMERRLPPWLGSTCSGL